MISPHYVVTGSRGQLGRCLVRSIGSHADRQLEAAWSHDELDIADERAVVRTFGGLSEGVTVINAAAFTAVDRCEEETETAYRANRDGPGVLARACRERGYGFAHVSTDYVFDGTSEVPYAESASTRPLSVYGNSKLGGEERVRGISSDFLVVRSSWVFGPGKNFVEAILRQARMRREGRDTTPLRVVDDQTGTPTYAEDLAVGLLRLIEGGAAGLVHLANAGAATWWQFAREILDLSGYSELSIDRAATLDLGLPAARPAHSLLDCSRAAKLGVGLRSWQEALAAYLASDDRGHDE